MGGVATGVQNIWTGYSESNEQYYEQRLIHRWSKLPDSAVKIENMAISEAEDDRIHCISISTGTKIPFVLIPGYGASGAMYYKLMKDLSEKYDLFIVDMRGMGW